MMTLRAVALGWHSDDFPGWVEISIRDARGQDHRIVEKASVLTLPEVTARSCFPIEFWIDATVESISGDEVVVTLPHGIETTEGRATLEIARAYDDVARYDHAMQWLLHSVHELPARVLWGPHAATPEQCVELMDGLDDFAWVCRRLGLYDHDEFIEACRWHFDHYRHYLSRRHHFADYATYIRVRRGPKRVEWPTRPLWH